MTIPFQAVYARFLSSESYQSLPPTDDSRTIGNHLRGLADRLLGKIIDRIRADLPLARRSLLTALSRRERLTQDRIANLGNFDPALEARSYPKVTNLLYAILSANDGLSSDLMRTVGSKGVARFLDWFHPIASEVITIASLATNLRRGEIIATFDGTELVYSKSRRHSTMVDSLANYKQLVRETARIANLDSVFSREALEIERLVLGYTARDIADLLVDRLDKLKSLTEVIIERDVYFVKVPKEDSWVRRMILGSTLSPERLLQVQRPVLL